MRVVIVESDGVLANSMQSFLSQRGMCLTCYADAKQAAGNVDPGHCDVVVVDAALAGTDGFALLAALRRECLQLPILMLTEGGRAADRLRGLRSGADDWLTKPFELEELEARIEALDRRARLLKANIEAARFGNLEVCFRNREAHVEGRRLDLCPKEYAVLEYLSQKCGELLAKQEIIESVWGYRFNTGTNILEVTVSRLRAKLLWASAEVRIRTVYGKGYLIEAV